MGSRDMDSKRHQKLTQLFLQACDLEDDKREAFVDRACVGDPELREELMALLERDEGKEDSGLTEILGRQVLSFEEPSAPPVEIARYTVLRRIGMGGMGEVLLVEQQEPIRRLMALKLVRSSVATPEIISRFESERQALAVMNHPNIARIYEVGETEDGRPYFAMEYIDGESIIDYCNTRRLDVTQRLTLFRQVAEGVNHAHQKGIIHRDLKPPNILVEVIDGRPVPKIIDFGISKAVGSGQEEDSSLTQTGVLVGTPEYMSPEQAEGSLDIDTRSDVYSLGLLLYELLVGSLPFERSEWRRAALDLQQGMWKMPFPRPSQKLQTRGARATRVARERSTDPAALRRRVRGDLDWIVLKALEIEPDRRYGTAGELAEDLQRHLRHEVVSAGPPSVVYRARKFIRRHMGMVASVGLLILLLTLFGATSFYQLQAQRRERERAETEARKARRVVEFLSNMLSAPTLENMGRDVKMRDVVGAASVTASTELSSEPRVEAAVRLAIGATYRSLNLYDQAEKEFERALEIRSRGDGTSSLELAVVHRELAALRFYEQRYREAADEYRQALALARAAPDPSAPFLAGINANLGLVLRQLGQAEAAKSLLTEAIELFESLAVVEGEENTDGLATAYESLAGILISEGRLDEAEEYMRATVKAKASLAGGKAHPGLATSLHNLAFVLDRKGRSEEALEIYQQSLEMEEQLTGTRRSRRVAGVLSSLGGCQLRLGHYRRAESLIREAWDIRREKLGSRKPGSAIVEASLAAALGELGEYEAAARLAEEAAEILRETLGDRHPSHARALGVLGEQLARLGQRERAERVLRQAISIRERAAPLRSLALLLLEEGRIDEAQVMADRQRAALEAFYGAGHDRVAAPLLEGSILEARGELERAEAAYRKALEARLRLHGEVHPELARAHLLLGECLARLGDLEQARTHARQALEIWQVSDAPPPGGQERARRLLTLTDP